MNRYTPNTPKPSLPWWRRRPLLIVAGLLLASCCFWSGLAAWLFAPFTYFMANRLSYVHGKAELIAPAQWHPGGILSPDGRYLLMGWTKNGPHEQFIWDLATGAQYPYKFGGGDCAGSIPTSSRYLKSPQIPTIWFRHMVPSLHPLH